jgi:hypothetical protein
MRSRFSASSASSRRLRRAWSSTSGFGIAGLVLGILACLTAWIPVVGLISVPIAALGLLFGFIGFIVSLAGRRSGIGMPVAASVICIVALCLQLLWAAAIVEGNRLQNMPLPQPASVEP